MLAIFVYGFVDEYRGYFYQDDVSSYGVLASQLFHDKSTSLQSFISQVHMENKLIQYFEFLPTDLKNKTKILW